MPDVILLDLMMPVMNGFEFIDALRRLPEGRVVPVIVITAKNLTREEYAQLGRNAGSIMEKSGFDAGSLLERLKNLLKDGRTARPEGD